MKKSFAARRLPRIIHDDEDEDSTTVVKPNNSSSSLRKNAAKSKSTHSSARGTSSALDNRDDDGDDTNPTNLPSTKRRPVKIQRPLLRRDSDDEDDKQANEGAYSEQHLQALRQATFSKQPSPPVERKKIDIAAKFGTIAIDRSYQTPTSTALVADSHSSHIPSEAEIREKKARRARLVEEAKESASRPVGTHDMGDGFVFIDESGQHPDESPEGRLVREDEEIAEGFDEFVEDDQVALGKRQELDWKAKKRAEMESMIADAQELESSSDEGEDEAHKFGYRGGAASDSDDEGRGYQHYTERTSSKRYDEAQIRAGNFATSVSLHKPDPVVGPVIGTGAMTPPKVTAIPAVADVLARLREVQAKLEREQGLRRERIGELELERAEVDESEKWVQKMLAETGRDYEQWQRAVVAERREEPSSSSSLIQVDTEPVGDDTAAPATAADAADDGDDDDQVMDDGEAESQGGGRFPASESLTWNTDSPLRRSERELTDVDPDDDVSDDDGGDDDDDDDVEVSNEDNADFVPGSTRGGLGFRSGDTETEAGVDVRPGETASRWEDGGGWDDPDDRQTRPKLDLKAILGNTGFVSGGKMPATGPDK